MRNPSCAVRRPQAGRRHRSLHLGVGGAGTATGVMPGIVAGVRGGHMPSPGTPAISRPWEIATRIKFALGILAPRISMTPRREHVPTPNARLDRGSSVTLSLSKGAPPGEREDRHAVR